MGSIKRGDVEKVGGIRNQRGKGRGRGEGDVENHWHSKGIRSIAKGIWAVKRIWHISPCFSVSEIWGCLKCYMMRIFFAYWSSAMGIYDVKLLGFLYRVFVRLQRVNHDSIRLIAHLLRAFVNTAGLRDSPSGKGVYGRPFPEIGHFPIIGKRMRNINTSRTALKLRISPPPTLL